MKSSGLHSRIRSLLLFSHPPVSFSGGPSATAIGKYSDDAKLTIVLTLYVQMVTYIQELRSRVERIVVVGSGLIVLLDGWLISASRRVTIPEKVVVSVGIALFTCVLAVVTRVLRRQFHGFAGVVRNLNEVQQVYARDVYLKGQMLYPEEWKSFGSAAWKEPVFVIALPIQLAVGLFGVIAVWLI